VQFVVYLAVVTTGLSYIIDTLPHTQVPHSCQMTLLSGGWVGRSAGCAADI